MKSLKITVLAIFSIALLTAVTQYNDTEPATTDNHEISKPKIKLTAFTDVKKKKAPSNG